MKRNGLLFWLFCLMRGYWVMLGLVLWMGSASGQIAITMQLPPPGRFNPEDFMKLLSFQNNTGQIQQVYLTGTVEEQTAGLIFSCTSAPFELMSGFSNPHYSVYEPVTTDFVDPVYEKSVVQTNSLPSGDYVVCVWVKEATTGNPLGTQCVPHAIFHPSAPVPVYPVGGLEVPEPTPLFTWLPPSPLPAVPVVYNLTIVELHIWQTPVEAMVSNPPFLRQEGIHGPTFPYPVHLPPMQEGHKYVWQVQALTEDGIAIGENNGFSEVEGFAFGQVLEPSITILHPVAVCVGEVTSEINTTTASIGWLAIGAFTQFQVVVYENPCGRYPPDGPKYPTPPIKKTPSQPTGPGGGKPGTPDKPPVKTDTVKGVPADTVPPKVGGGPVTTPWEPDTSGKGVTVVPAGGTGTGVTTWPEGDDDHDYRPPLPPGWAWGPGGCYWTGEHPPEPPALPPGWEWGPLRPYWAGTGAAPPERTIVHVSSPIAATPQTNPMDEAIYQVTLPLEQSLQPGQAFIYQIYGIYQASTGETEGFLSESQCIRYSPLSDTEEKPEPQPCNICHVRLEPRIGPKMDGGLDPPNDSVNIFRDEFLVLKARGEDYDELWWFCTPGPDCPETPSTNMRVTSSRVKYTWEITDGEGSFVELGCSGSKRSTEGDRVIFMPPAIRPDSTAKTTVKLSIIDDNRGQPTDPTVERMITITTKRDRKKIQEYTILIESDPYRLPQPSQVTGLIPGTCITQGPNWTRDQDLTTPQPKLPGVKEADKLVFGEMIRLYAEDIRDPDKITVWCHSTQCDTNVFSKDFGDEVEFEWKIVKGEGSFIKGNKGRWVVYQAPEKEGEVEIEVRASNPSSLKIKDRRSDAGKIQLTVFQPGVRMDITPLSWLPKADSTKLLEKRSYLVYKKDDKWETALDHQCRIHLVQLMDISNEPGICLNWPYKTDREDIFIDECADLTLKMSSKYELYDTVTCERWGCNGAETWFMGAGSLKPSKELRVKVMVWDYGGYGFIRSVANGDGDLKTPYESVGWTEKEYHHPIRGFKRKEYTDNRVTIPRDADENRIADGGYEVTEFSKVMLKQPSVEKLIKKVYIKDERNPVMDVDNKPANASVGDGISNYEEYRGFWAKGRHVMLNPNQKNLFVYDPDHLGSGSFGNSDIRLVLIDLFEMEEETRVINRNRKTHQLGFDQVGTMLWINPTLPYNGVAGYVDSIGLAFCDTVHINQWVVDAGQRWVDYIVAHELSHAVGSHHHGQSNVNGYIRRGDTVHISGKDSVNNIADFIYFRVMLQHGVSSGDERCWMRYCRVTEYCFAPDESMDFPLTPLDNNYNVLVDLKNRKLVKRPDSVMGTVITNQTTGSGVNRSGHCGGNASTEFGSCLNQIKINQKP